MNISILEKPLSLAEIENKRKSLEINRSKVLILNVCVFLFVVLGLIIWLTYRFESLSDFLNHSIADSIQIAIAFFGICAFLGIQTFLWMLRSADVSYQIEKLTLLDLKNCDSDKCLEIKEWLQDEDIRAFRDALVEQGRSQFIRAEYYAMQDHWKNRSERLRKQTAEEACKEIFLGGIMQGKA